MISTVSSESVNFSSITLAVLAGGEGRRMGQAKAELHIAGKYILDYLLDRWRWPGPTLLVTAPGRQHPPGHDRFTAEAVDPVAGQGPLRGVITALEACETQLLLLTTVDMPRVNTGQFAWFIEQMRRTPDRTGIFASRGQSDRLRIEPFPSVLQSCTAASVRSWFDAGNRSVHGLIELPGFDVRPAPTTWSDDLWINLNRPEDIQNFQE